MYTIPIIKSVVWYFTIMLSFTGEGGGGLVRYVPQHLTTGGGGQEKDMILSDCILINIFWKPIQMGGRVGEGDNLWLVI